MARILIDATGSLVGGAARFRTELEAYLERSQRRDITIIDSGGRMSTAWLARREAHVRRISPSRVIALNNLSFQTGPDRTVLLRNALHFLDRSEIDELAGIDPLKLRAQAWMVHRMAGRAQRIVVPSTAMATRVRRVLGDRRGRRVDVLAHPVSAGRSLARRRDSLSLLCPVLNAPYKRLASRLRVLIETVADHPELELRLTMDGAEFPYDVPPNVRLLGRLTVDEMTEHYERCRAIVFPLTLEAFGYPLAESRIHGLPVLAPPCDLTIEVAGSSFVPCDFELRSSVCDALKVASRWSIETPSENPFDPERYFDELLDGSMTDDRTS